MRDLSLTGRLGLSFAGLIFLAAGFSLGLIFKQHSETNQRGAAVLHAHESISLGVQLRQLLDEIDRKAGFGRWSTEDFKHFNNILGILETKSETSENKGTIIKIKSEFSDYSKLLQEKLVSSESYLANPHLSDLEKQISKNIGDALLINENSIFQFSKFVVDEQRKTVQIDAAMLLGFMLLVLIVSSRMVSYIISPLSRLVEFLDTLDIEGDLPKTMAHISPRVPEIARLTGSFDSLFQRLRGYRQLNLRRLLNEKRRADIIAASISDGIFLLRGNELLYKNHTAERILGETTDAIPTGLARAGQVGKRNLGLEAVMKAVTHSLPVEYSIEVEGKKLYYLLQSIPIPFDLIEEVEHSFGNEGEQVLDRFLANTLVLAQEVTLVKEGQEAKSHFLATLSHEIKTPVTSLTMATRLLKKWIEEFPNPTHRNLINTCAEDVDRLRGLLENLLVVTRFDSLTQQLEIQKIDLGKLLVHSVQSFHSEAKERGIDLSHQVVHHGKPIMVAMDATKVAWALSNLITNALRHTPRGGRVQVFVESYNDRAEIRVQDTGPGIERHRQSRIFDKFSSYYDLRVGRSGSIGAGLAVAREIVVGHGGRIWVESEPGKGSQFSFTLPLSRSGVQIELEESLSKQIGEG